MLRNILCLVWLLGFGNIALAQTGNLGSQYPIGTLGEIKAAAATVIPVRQTCRESACPEHDAIVFVHGIYGDEETFRNGQFDWPKEVDAVIEGRKIDVYRIDYKTAFLRWLPRNIATMDEVVYSVFKALHPDPETVTPVLDPSRYRSVNFIAHSLGGNVVASFLHTVKSELGHFERARYGFVITLGTPVNGAQISTVAQIARIVLRMPKDRLLESLKSDNTFLRMLQHWRRSENIKAARFHCRKVNLYVGIEGATTFGIKVVSRGDAQHTVKDFVDEDNVMYFPTYNHSRMAKPIDRQDDLYKWVNKAIVQEMKTLGEWRGPLCDRQF